MPRIRTSQELESSELRRYALVGAQARLEAITSELEAIRRAFPELASRNVRAAAAGDAASRPRRGRMSAAQRKAVGERMKKYWAARRAGSERSAVSSKTSNGTSATGARKGVGRVAGTAQISSQRAPRKMSAAGRKRISDAQKKRWAALRRVA